MSNIALDNPDPAQVEQLFNEGVEDEGRTVMTEPLLPDSRTTVATMDMTTEYNDSDNEVGCMQKYKGLWLLAVTLVVLACTATGIALGAKHDDNSDDDDNKLKPTQPPNSFQYCGTDPNNINCDSPCSADVDCLLGSCYISPFACTQYCASQDGLDIDCGTNCASDDDCFFGRSCILGIWCTAPTIRYCATNDDGNSTLCDSPCEDEDDCFFGQSCLIDFDCIISPPTLTPTATSGPTNAPFSVQYCGTEDEMDCDSPCIFDDDCSFGKTCMLGLSCETGPPVTLSPTGTTTTISSSTTTTDSTPSPTTISTPTPSPGNTSTSSPGNTSTFFPTFSPTVLNITKYLRCATDELDADCNAKCTADSDCREKESCMVILGCSEDTL